MVRRKPRKRRFGSVRKLPSGRFQARYTAPDGLIRTAPETFRTKTDADLWLSETEADISREEWTDPWAGDIPFGEYAARWVAERGLAPTTAELYRRLLRTHLSPTFGGTPINGITPVAVRSWRADRLGATGATTVAKAYRLLKAVMQTAVEDGLIRRNPCRIKGAGQEAADERPIASVDEVFRLAECVGVRWRLLVLLGAFASLRPEELAELRRHDVDLERGVLRIRRAAPELTTGRRAPGDPKSRAGKRDVVVPTFLLLDLRRHLEWFAEDADDGLLFVGEKGAPFRRSTFGRRWRKARTTAGLPDRFRFYDLRHTGNTLAADTGAKLKDLMVRAGQSSTRAQLIYQHSTERHQRKIADSIDVEVRRHSDRRTPDET
ncbi:site-specific integrase [Streptomyces sp. NBC_01808]|uniref:tyrosine-type recombinase/integrase n=1 Tax=Streptomyces sp. NBC_01808 TaxID=2975947 RepID=UPI002DDB84D7|nr:tyrosine-type recombinase/integrase [Streptomyces sp. NBC_01808]WSA39297.1 site-specific integrase [Streptomyces sp. NBC_01808]